MEEQGTRPARFRRLRRTGAPTVEQARRRLLDLGGMRLGRGRLVAALLLALLGLGLVAQVRVTDEAGLDQLRQTELVALLDDTTNRVLSLQEEVRTLEADRDRLQGSEGDEAATRAAQERLESYQILAGQVPVRGPGITIQVQDPGAVVTQTMLLDGIQELRDAGAEAIQIGGVRVVASSWVGADADGRLTIDDRLILPPYTIVAIGDSHTLAGAMAIPGGFTDSLRGAGATVSVTEAPTVQVEALHEARPPRYAQPVPAEQSP
ncbi:DUF881 domain-containing protein [Ornithinimicrobium pratense]|uniref:DUF881 domain-containing protein n=1 Tax=Ornithinimicrobium pratense TaxID=2593973 RepID=A0A5J6V6C7_9MICO|nr:DUF881 domain-containing protein [Ornithinimicrobium pratense]QFG68592.1 DUF881 domain-containing protein [Ornithinimicrobium pratense]